MIFPSRSQLICDLSLTRTDQMDISKRRGDPHRLGCAYQLGFVRVFQRIPIQQPLEICVELLNFVALQTGIVGRILGRLRILAGNGLQTPDPNPRVSRAEELLPGP